MTAQNADGRVVVGVDDSPGGRAALAYALREGTLRGAEVEVISAFASPDYWACDATQGWAAAPTIEEIREDVLRHVEQIVAHVRAQLGDAGATDVRVRAVGSSAAAALIDASRGAELLVVGSRGRGGFASMLLGSVSLQCVLHATCPVTVVPTPAGDSAADGRHRMAAASN
ncbi:MAG: universal stress protein [Pseudonocardia sp.]|nr:universal stress protein [Pseudonocardia sp.]